MYEQIRLNSVPLLKYILKYNGDFYLDVYTILNQI